MKDMMPNMKGYGQSYKPPGGSAGGEAHGAFSHKKNPRPVPRKGSSLSEAGMGNADRSKVMKLEKEQARNESLRGEGC